MDIEWQEGAVCFAGGSQFKAWDINRGELITVDNVSVLDFETALSFKDFQLNTIKQGDFIAASELDTEQRYNDAIEVFGLFGFALCNDGNDFEWLNSSGKYKIGVIVATESRLMGVRAEFSSYERKRKLTYPQIMAIGKLNGLEIERDSAVDAPPNHFLPKAGGYALSEDKLNKQEVKMQKNKPVVAQVMIDLTERMETGIKTYGEALRANNGRDALQDAYEEALDLACYLKQAMIERDNENTN